MPVKYHIIIANEQYGEIMSVDYAKRFKYYMQLCDALEKTAKENDAPEELIKHLPVLLGCYLDQYQERIRH